MNEATTSKPPLQTTLSAQPYAALSPDLILDAIDETLGSIGKRTDGRLFALNSYENRVYQIGIEDQPPMVAKFYRPNRWTNPQILEEHAFVFELNEREVPVVAPLVLNGQSLHEFKGFRFSLFPKRGGRAPELDRPEVLEWIGRFMGRIHAVGAIKPYMHRPTHNLTTFGIEPRDFLLASDFIPVDLREAWATIAQQALDGVAACYERAGAGVGFDAASSTLKLIRLHGDCHGGNVLYTDVGPHFVDFDDSRMGPAMQDLWMLLAGSREEMAAQLREVIEAYEEFYEFDRRELHLIEALRTLRLIHYSSWLAQRWGDPAFPHAFPFFNTQRYWQDRILELREQIGAMSEEPLALMP